MANDLEGYRLVPVKEDQQKQDLDFLELFNFFKSKKVVFLKLTLIFGLVGFLVTISIPEKYESNSLLLQDQKSGGGASELLSKYGGMLGISSIPGLSEGTETNPELLPQIVKSADFIKQILDEPIYFGGYDTLMSTSEFYTSVYEPPFLLKMITGIADIPDMIKQFLFSKEDALATEQEDISRYSYEEMKLIDQLRDQIYIEVDEITTVIKISSEMPDPYSASEMTALIVRKLTSYLSNYKTSKINRDLNFLKSEYLISKQHYEMAESRLSEAIDRNMNLSTSKSRLEIEHLRNERDLRFNIYNSLAQQLEQLKITLNENVPVFQALQKPVFPHERKSPKRIRLIVIFIFAGLAASAVYFFIRYSILNSLNK